VYLNFGLLNNTIAVIIHKRRISISESENNLSIGGTE